MDWGWMGTRGGERGHRSAVRRARAFAVPAFVAAAVLTTGCSWRPSIDGPQVTVVPEGFAFDISCSAARVLLPDRRTVRQRCWFDSIRTPRVFITITESVGSLDAEEAESAWDEYTDKWSHGGEEHDELETLEVDGCPAWGWTTRLDSKVVAYRLLVSGEAESFAVEVTTPDVALLAGVKPRDVALSFRRDRPGRVSGPLLGLLVLLGLGATSWAMLRRQRQEAAAEELRAEARARAEAARAARAAAASAAAGQAGEGPPTAG